MRCDKTRPKIKCRAQPDSARGRGQATATQTTQRRPKEVTDSRSHLPTCFPKKNAHVGGKPFVTMARVRPKQMGKYSSVVQPSAAHPRPTAEVTPVFRSSVSHPDAALLRSPAIFPSAAPDDVGAIAPAVRLAANHPRKSAAIMVLRCGMHGSHLHGTRTCRRQPARTDRRGAFSLFARLGRLKEVGFHI